MKKLIVSVLATGCLIVGLTGCTSQEIAKNYGGTTTINLPANQKLEGISWKDSDLWYLTRPMKPEEEAETHTYAESSTYGVWEGTVIIKESKTK